MIPMLQANSFTHLKDLEAGSPAFWRGPTRKPYQSPVLVEWGSLVDLTRGPKADIQDDDFSGSGGV
jgi:hypothetical protein